MFLRKAALRPVPRHAVVDDHVIDVLEQSLDADESGLQDALDRGFGELERRQPALGAYLSGELAGARDELVQSLGYFLAVTVYMAFRDAFPTRLSAVGEDDLAMAQTTLEVDEQLRAEDPTEIYESDDVVAMGQPAVLGYVQHHVQEALEQAEDEIDFDDLDRIYRTLLVMVISLSHSVRSPSGELGPPREALA